jgi:hypothetical protein
VEQGWNAFAYIYNGTGSVSGSRARRGHALVLGPGGHLTASSSDPAGLRFLLFAGKPIGEPIQQWVPLAPAPPLRACWVPSGRCRHLLSARCLVCTRRHGPFVMNSMHEIRQAYADYQSGRLQDPGDDPWTDEHQDL